MTTHRLDDVLDGLVPDGSVRIASELELAFTGYGDAALPLF